MNHQCGISAALSMRRSCQRWAVESRWNSHPWQLSAWRPTLLPVCTLQSTPSRPPPLLNYFKATSRHQMINHKNLSMSQLQIRTLFRVTLIVFVHLNNSSITPNVQSVFKVPKLYDKCLFFFQLVCLRSSQGFHLANKSLKSLNIWHFPCPSSLCF